MVYGLFCHGGVYAEPITFNGGIRRFSVAETKGPCQRTVVSLSKDKFFGSYFGI